MFDSNGEIMKDLTALQEHEFVFVKKTPDFDLGMQEFRRVYQKIAKLRALTQPDNQGRYDQKSNKNSQSIVHEDQIEVMLIEPRKPVEDELINKKLN